MSNFPYYVAPIDLSGYENEEFRKFLVENDRLQRKAGPKTTGRFNILDK